MAVLTLNKITTAGVSATYASAGASGDSFPATSDERVFLHVKNGSASPVTITIAPQTLAEKVPGVGTIVPPTLTGTAAATSDCLIGPFARDYIGANGQVQVSYSAVATVTVAAYSLNRVD